MSHHAYTFDDAGFHKTLEPLLDRVFEDNERERLLAFLGDHISGWQAQAGDAPTLIRLARLALTAYCEPTDIGLGDGWRAARQLLADLYPEGRVFVTGNEVRHLPGLYYQSAAYVAASATLIERIWSENRPHGDQIEPARRMLQAAAQAGRGLLIEAS